MPRKAGESAATKTLLKQVESQATGRLSVGARAAEISVWVLKGEVVAATSPGDEPTLVRMAGLAGGLDARSQGQLQRRINEGESVFGPLLDAIPPALSDRLLGDRFRANLVEFVGSMSRPTFTALKAVFVDNLQFGGNTRALISTSAETADAAMALDLDAEVSLGPNSSKGELEGRVRRLLRSEQMRVGALLDVLPGEPILVRGWLQGALESGLLVVIAPPAESNADWVEDDATENSVPVVAAVSAMAPEQAAAMRSWLSKAHLVEESELDFFEDHDSTRRGGSGDSSFTTGAHNLEKLEVNLGDSPSSEEDLEAEEAPEAEEPLEGADETLEAEQGGEEEEAPPARFSAPSIGENEASTKIAVINSVLQSICGAFDEAEGPGRGREAFQLLVEGSPPRYQPIFDGIQVAEAGTLPPAEVISNLLARPVTEQRLLLNQALSDLIDRALSGAADQLPDEVVDALLEDTAGYRGRMGL